MTNIAAQALQVQIKALIEGWQRDATEARAAAQRGRRELSLEGNDLYRYHQGEADALDRCARALKLLET